MSKGRTGRRRGKPDTREQILVAARQAFADRGFERATVRQIAQDAGVDAALVHHYFGSKDKLLLATIEAPFDPVDLVPQIAAGGVDELGDRLVRTFLRVWDSPAGDRGVALLRSAMNHPMLSRLLQQFFMSRVLRTVVRELDVELTDAPFRVTLVASQLLGLAMTRYVLRLEPLAGAAHDDIAVMLGPTVQRYVTGPLRPGGEAE